MGAQKKIKLNIRLISAIFIICVLVFAALFGINSDVRQHSGGLELQGGSMGGDINLTAYAENSYQLTFDSRGGSRIWSKEAVYGSAVGELFAPTRTGYLFAGWWTTANGGMQYTANTIYTQAGDTQLYARWVAEDSQKTAGNLIAGVEDGIVILVCASIDIAFLLILSIILHRNKKTTIALTKTQKKNG
jgi:uncharacterized repeat protein (TIGR02543 family)